MSGNSERITDIYCSCRVRRVVYRVFDVNGVILGWINSPEYLGSEKHGAVNPKDYGPKNIERVSSLLELADVFMCESCSIDFTRETRKGKSLLDYGGKYLHRLQEEM